MSAADRGARRQRREAVAARLPRWWPLAALTVLAAVLRLSHARGCRASGTTRPSRRCTCCTRASCTTLEWVPNTENSPPLWYLLEWLDYRAARQRRVRAAAALGARRDRARARRVGDRPRARRPRRGDRMRGARHRRPAVRLVLAGGARLRAVRVHQRARDARFVRVLREPTRRRVRAGSRPPARCAC